MISNQKYSNYFNNEVINNIANPESLSYYLNHKSLPKYIYCGFDPTAKSLHIGNYIQLLMLEKMQKLGFKPIIVIGEATAMIGDPSGKKSERKFIEPDLVRKNSTNIKKFFQKHLPNAIIVNNLNWIKKITFIEALRKYGKYFNISKMIKKHTIATRLETGISYTEFTYSVLQSVDFLFLFKKYNCVAQIGGADQWGNMVSGIELINKLVSPKIPPFVITFNLLVNDNGEKFGKSEKTDNIWLDPELTSPYNLYQFFLNQNDKDLLKLFSFFTLYTNDEIHKIIELGKKNSNKRYSHEVLAKYIVEKLYGKQMYLKVKNITKALFTGKVSELAKNDFLHLCTSIKVNKLTNVDKTVPLSVNLKNNLIIGNSNEFKDLLKNKTLIINDKVISENKYNFDKKNALFDKYFYIKKGKKNYYILEII